MEECLVWLHSSNINTVSKVNLFSLHIITLIVKQVIHVIKCAKYLLLFYYCYYY